MKFEALWLSNGTRPPFPAAPAISAAAVAAEGRRNTALATDDKTATKPKRPQQERQSGSIPKQNPDGAGREEAGHASDSSVSLDVSLSAIMAVEKEEIIDAGDRLPSSSTEEEPLLSDMEILTSVGYGRNNNKNKGAEDDGRHQMKPKVS